MADKFSIKDQKYSNSTSKNSLLFIVFFDFFSTQTLRKISYGVMLISAYVFLVDYLENHILHVAFKPPSTLYTLLGTVLGLLLVFRTNTAYDRWWQGRILISSLTNSSKNFASKLNAILPKYDIENRKFFAYMIANHVFSMKEVLRYGVKFDELIETHPGELKELKKVYHVPSEIVSQIHLKLTEMYRKKELSDYQFLEMHKYIDNMTNIVGDCERIRTSPMPFSYRVHLKKFILFFALMLPFGFIHYLDYWSILIVGILFYAMSGLDVLGEEIEDPFGQDENDLPIDFFCKSIKKYVFTTLKVDLQQLTLSKYEKPH
ncbi:MAG: hypothetical protein EAZ27_07175 [Cytophagales bacterium]|nr:MAG: hypothetical protein EAZ27_07175 [Cytophagales bacterium]